jgi:3-oxoacyl-[acyl-carrier protein] reductase
MELDGKVAFVAGGSGDIGGAIAISLAKRGVDVAVSYVGDSQRAEATVDAVKKIGRRSLAEQLDQRDSNSVDTSVKKVMAEFGRLDILVNNAGWNIGIPFRDLNALTAEIWDRVYCLACRNNTGRQQHSLRVKQGRPNSPHALLGSGACT